MRFESGRNGAYSNILGFPISSRGAEQSFVRCREGAKDRRATARDDAVLLFQVDKCAPFGSGLPEGDCSPVCKLSLCIPSDLSDDGFESLEISINGVLDDKTVVVLRAGRPAVGETA